MALKINKDKKIITLRLEEEVFTNDTVIKSREFADRDDLVEIVIPEGITRIEKDAFIGCNNFKYLSFSSPTLRTVLRISLDLFSVSSFNLVKISVSNT